MDKQTNAISILGHIVHPQFKLIFHSPSPPPEERPFPPNLFWGIAEWFFHILLPSLPIKRHETCLSVSAEENIMEEKPSLWINLSSNCTLTDTLTELWLSHTLFMSPRDFIPDMESVNFFCWLVPTHLTMCIHKSNNIRLNRSLMLRPVWTPIGFRLLTFKQHTNSSLAGKTAVCYLPPNPDPTSTFSIF